MSLSKLYSLKIKKQEKREKTIEEETNSDNDDTFTKLKKLSITPELAKQWVQQGCGKPC